jgi:glucosamine--fructose-6-phosphate aminotransferase (isomerizing)
MCGIIVVISKNYMDVINYILQGLSIIQNRGYDSVGIAYKKTNNNYNIVKYASEQTSDSFEKIKSHFNNKNISSDIAIGHTRWATHGSKTEKNAHPHISYNKHIVLVHNGIINNYKKLKDFLLSKKYQFYSDTDTEVIVNLIEYYYLKDDECINNIEKSICKANACLEGTWALAIVNVLDPTNIYITRHGSPLVLGYSDELLICASEISAFSGLVLNYIVLDNNDIIQINSHGYKSINSSSYNIKTIAKEEVVNTSFPYPHWTLKEIMEQPHVINLAINNGGRIIDNSVKLGGVTQLFKLLNNKVDKIKHIMLFGCGTSYHACLMSKYYFNTKKTLHIIDGCEFNENDIPYTPQDEKILCIFCSQSGETIDLVKCIEICKKNSSCITFGVINVIDSLISRLVSCGVYINAGNEIAVASTKSFTNTCIVLSLIAYSFNEEYTYIDNLNNLRILSPTVNNMLYNLEVKEKLTNICDYIVNNNINNIFLLGKNKLHAVAKEISLKIKEICYIHAEGYSSSSLKHGPFALLDKTNLTILLIDYYDKDNLKSLESTYNEILSRDTNIIVISNNSQIINIINSATELLILPKLDFYNEIIFTIALQLLSYYISVSKNINPDKPRNLAKVVTVE